MYWMCWICNNPEGTHGLLQLQGNVFVMGVAWIADAGGATVSGQVAFTRGGTDTIRTASECSLWLHLSFTYCWEVV